MKPVLIIAATHRPGSLSLNLSQQYQAAWQAQTGPATVLNLQELPPAFVTEDLFGKRSAAFMPFQEAIHAAEKYVFVVPEYNGGIPGMLKLFIDACQYPESFAGKKAALVGISAGAGGCENGLNHLTDVLSYLRTAVLPQRVHIPRIRTRIDENRLLSHPDSWDALHAQMAAFRDF